MNTYKPLENMWDVEDDYDENGHIIFSEDVDTSWEDAAEDEEFENGIRWHKW